MFRSYGVWEYSCYYLDVFQCVYFHVNMDSDVKRNRKKNNGKNRLIDYLYEFWYKEKNIKKSVKRERNVS